MINTQRMEFIFIHTIVNLSFKHHSSCSILESLMRARPLPSPFILILHWLGRENLQILVHPSSARKFPHLNPSTRSPHYYQSSIPDRSSFLATSGSGMRPARRLSAPKSYRSSLPLLAPPRTHNSASGAPAPQSLQKAPESAASPDSPGKARR